jgi:phosphatidate cytidylyltransferase
VTGQISRRPWTDVLSHLSNFQARVISGIVMAVVVLGLTWAGGAAFRVLAAAIGAAVFFEWEAITWVRQTGRSRLLGWVCIAPVLILLVVGVPAGLLLVLMVAGIGMLVASCYARCRLWPAAGLAYATFPVISLAMIRGANVNGLAAILFLFAVVWATDIFAYFAGRSLGGPKLAPRISPSKTWSGAIGGTVAGVIAGTCVAWVADGGAGAHIPLIALSLSVVAQIGDLGESWVKRKFGVKDSSRIIPGHGGVMDRVDGLVAAASLMYVVVMVLIGLSAGGAALTAI